MLSRFEVRFAKAEAGRAKITHSLARLTQSRKYAILSRIENSSFISKESSHSKQYYMERSHTWGCMVVFSGVWITLATEIRVIRGDGPPTPIYGGTIICCIVTAEQFLLLGLQALQSALMDLSRLYTTLHARQGQADVHLNLFQVPSGLC